VADNYDQYSRDELLRLLRERDRKPKLGLVWERNEIEHDKSLNDDFVALDLDPELSCGDAPYENLIIEGDNFDALRYLRMTHSGQVKCIYIDPPYNTGNRDFIYNDHFVDKDDAYKHSKWLEFMYRRLLLAKDLLREDGVLMVSINDENRAKLDMLLESVFPGMRMGSFVWRNRQGSNADQSCFLSGDHEHVLVYGNPEFSFSGIAKTYSMYSNPDKDVRGDWRQSDLTLGYSYKDRPNLYYPLFDTTTGVYYPPNPERVWVYASRDRLKPGARVQAKPMEEFIEIGQILFPQEQRVETWETMDALLTAIDDGDVPKSGKTPLLRRELPGLEFWVGKPVGYGRPAFKRYKADLRNKQQPLSSWITPKFEAKGAESTGLISGTNQEGAKLMSEIFDDKRFSYPKPLSLITGLVAQATQGDDIILDFFAGSGTTAHAVLTANTQDNGHRRFILVSSTEANASDPGKNICRDVCAERLRRVISGYKDKKGLGVSFAYLRTTLIPVSRVFNDIQHEQVWRALLLIHSIPLTAYDNAACVQLAGDADDPLIYVAKLSEAALDDVIKQAGLGGRLVVYSWQPGQIRQRVEAPNVVFERIPEFLSFRFGGGK